MIYYIYYIMSESLEILENVKNGKITIEHANSMILKLSSSKNKTPTYKVSPKGAISFYGMRKMPISLYLQELDKIVSIYNTSEFSEFLKSNADQIHHK
jgi:hypothetical protein